jgi:hypothetical protein
VTTVSRRQLRDRLAAIPVRFAAASSAAARQPNPAGEWSVREVVLHELVTEEAVWLPRLRMVAEQNGPAWPWVEPGLGEMPDPRSLESVLAAFAAARGTTIAHLDALDDAGWARTGNHATYGVLDVAGLMERAIDHDEEHAIDIERRAAAS